MEGEHGVAWVNPGAVTISINRVDKSVDVSQQMYVIGSFLAHTINTCNFIIAETCH